MSALQALLVALLGIVMLMAGIVLVFSWQWALLVGGLLVLCCAAALYDPKATTRKLQANR